MTWKPRSWTVCQDARPRFLTQLCSLVTGRWCYRGKGPLFAMLGTLGSLGS